MATRVSLGAFIGVIVSLLSLSGNRAVRGVTLFPDLFTPLVLLGLTWLAVWLCARREQPSVSTWQVARTISATAGLIFAAAITILGILRFRHAGHPFAPIEIIPMTIMFLTAFVSALVCGMIAGALTKGMARHP